MAVDDAFILYLLEIIEGVSDDAQDPYHYPVIRVLVRLSLFVVLLSLTVAAGSERAVPGRVDGAAE